MTLEPEKVSPGHFSPLPDTISTDHDELREHHRIMRIRARAAKRGYSTDDLAWYSIETLKVLVEAVLGGFVPMPPAESIRSGGDPAEGGDIHAALADVSRGIYKLIPVEHRAVLLLLHGGYIEPAYEDVELAYQALQEALGGPRPRGL